MSDASSDLPPVGGQVESGQPQRNSAVSGPRGERLPIGANELVSFPCDGPVLQEGTGLPITNDHSALMKFGDTDVWVPTEHAAVRDGKLTMPAWRARDLGMDLGDDKIDEDNRPSGLSAAPFGANPSQKAGSTKSKKPDPDAGNDG